MPKRTVFISYSSKDRDFARRLASDLKARCEGAWFDEWEIKVGDSITQKINDGIRDNDYLAVVLSPHSVASPWVKKELNSAMMKELNGKSAVVLPILYEDCEIPSLLADKYYADFRSDYQSGLNELLQVLAPASRPFLRLKNPFIFGAPVPPTRFIGRGQEISTILTQLTNPYAHGSSAISGGRRIGKTSLLHYIASPEAALKYGLSHTSFVFVSLDAQTLSGYADSQGVERLTEDIFWRYVVQFLTTFKMLDDEFLKNLHSQKEIKTFDLIPLFDKMATSEKLLVLLLDELEWIIDNIDPEHPTLLNTLRTLINQPLNKRGLALITASGKPPEYLCTHIRFSGSALPSSLTPVYLKPFSFKETNELIDHYLRESDVTFTARDREFVYEVSRGHPYWLQNACFKLFERYVEKGTS